jgi:hypothetical protein
MATLADAPTVVEWVYTPYGDAATFVSITNTGSHGDAQSVAQQAMGSTGEFTIVLAGLKVLLEHNVQLNLVAGRLPTGLTEQ